jgi:tetratricopeptide (TPR) repeat protein
LQGAIADCTKLLDLQPKDISALSFRGFSYYKLGEFERAIADFDSALAVNPAAAMPLFGRGLAKRRNGNAKDADKDMEMAKKKQPDIGLTVALWGVW